MSKREIDRNIRDILKKNIKKEIETEEGSVFSRTEVMRKIRNHIRWKGNSNENSLAKMHSTGQISRRRFLKMLGLGAGGAVVATSGAGYFFGTKIFHEKGMGPTGYATNVPDSQISSAPGNNVVNVSSLSEAASEFQDGNKVILASGSYSWDEDIADDLLGKDIGNASLIGDGEVILERDKRDHIRHHLTATDNVRVQNFTISGKRGVAQSQNRMNAESGATINWVNFNMPDGTMMCTDSVGVDIDSDNEGVVNIINCSYRFFGNSAVYVNESTEAPVNVDSCFFANTAAGGIRLFSKDMMVQRCVGVTDKDDIPDFQGGADPGDSMNCGGGGSSRIMKCEKGSGTVRDCDFVIEDVDAAGPILAIKDDESSSGEFRDIRIRNESSEDPISADDGYADPWTAENICIIGSGSKEVPGPWEDAVNSNCSSVKSTPPTNSNWYNTVPGSGSGGSGTSGGTTTTTNTIEIRGGSASNPRHYVMATNGIVTASSQEPTDSVYVNKATGIVAGSSDVYEVQGKVTEFKAQSGITVVYNGTEMTPQEFRNSSACL